MAFDIIDGRSCPGTLGQGLTRRWRAFLWHRCLHEQARIVEEFDDFRRLDIGLPLRGAPVRQVYYHW